MATYNYIRARLIRIVQKEQPIIRNLLLRKFDSGVRSQVDYQIGELISDGVFITTGIGRRGMPEKIQLSPVFPAMRCPFCLHDTLGTIEQRAKLDPLGMLP